MVVAGLGLLTLALMVWLQRRDTRRVGRVRRDAVLCAQGALSDVTVEQDGIGYPTLRGRHAGHAAKVELIVDTVTLRRLPRLWLAVTLRCPTGVEQPVDVLLSPSPTDIVSPGARFRYAHPAPAGWPEHVRVGTPGPGSLGGLGAVAALATVLGEPETKSVLVAPHGVRVVTELARGDVAPYRVTRRPDFHFALAEARLRLVLDDVLAIAEETAATAAPAGSGV